MKNFLWIFFVSQFVSAFSYAAEDKKEGNELANKIFSRLTSISLRAGDPRLDQMIAHIDAGNPQAAAQIATNNINFFNVTLIGLVAPWSSADSSPLSVFDDMQATAVGIIRDRDDFRSFLTGTNVYIGNPIYRFPKPSPDNRHYEDVAGSALNLSEVLVKQTRADQRNIGIFGSQSFGRTYYEGGTNRRAVKYAMQHFLCKPQSSWREPNLPDDFVRRDVNRTPTGVVAEYQRECRGCHAPMDAFSGAFAFVDYEFKDGIKFLTKVAPKYNLHADVFPEGYTVSDGSWVNYLAMHQNKQFGFKGPNSGNTLEDFASLLANSRAFGECMVSRSIDVVCGPARNQGKRRGFVSELTNAFEAKNFDLRSVFEMAAVSPLCD